ncbi:unnamed protein product [Symbiodinium natans]|uniref:Uncharacterized protein n=1 Tax=Symbiodinium natans TaxID=878477 RepID=A0A812SGY8_9DINO|nr:unnamed protein product [Symbiodinium natans]
MPTLRWHRDRHLSGASVLCLLGALLGPGRADDQSTSTDSDRFCDRWGPCGAQSAGAGCSFEDWLQAKEEAEAPNSTGDMGAARECLKDAYGCVILAVDELAEGCRPGVLRVLLAGLDFRLRHCEQALECVLEVEHGYSRVQALWPRAGVPQHWGRRWSLQWWRRKVDVMFDREDGIRALRGVCVKWLSSAATNRVKLPWIGQLVATTSKNGCCQSDTGYDVKTSAAAASQTAAKEQHPPEKTPQPRKKKNPSKKNEVMARSGNWQPPPRADALTAHSRVLNTRGLNSFRICN